MSFGYEDDSASQEEEKTFEQQGEHVLEENERACADRQKESGLEVEHTKVTVKQQPKVTEMPESGYRTASERTC